MPNLKAPDLFPPIVALNQKSTTTYLYSSATTLINSTSTSASTRSSYLSRTRSPHREPCKVGIPSFNYCGRGRFTFLPSETNGPPAPPSSTLPFSPSNADYPYIHKQCLPCHLSHGLCPPPRYRKIANGDGAVTSQKNISLRAFREAEQPPALMSMLSLVSWLEVVSHKY